MWYKQIYYCTNYSVYCNLISYCAAGIYVTGFEGTRLPRTQQEDTLFSITRQLYTLANISARYQC